MSIVIHLTEEDVGSTLVYNQSTGKFDVKSEYVVDLIYYIGIIIESPIDPNTKYPNTTWFTLGSNKWRRDV